MLDDNWGPTADHHALWTTFISWLGLHGVDPLAQIRLTCHAQPGITIKHYQDFRLFDRSPEVRKLSPIKAEGQTERLPLFAQIPLSAPLRLGSAG